MEIYANAYLQLTDGTILMADLTTGDTVSNGSFDGVAWSLYDVLQQLNETYPQLDAQTRQTLKEFSAAWTDVLSGWEMNNLLQNEN